MNAEVLGSQTLDKLNPCLQGGYYKPDVYLYYALTFVLPLIVGLRKKTKA